MKSLKDLEWWVKFRDPQEIYKLHPSFLKMEYIMYFCSLLTLVHALRNGGRYKWLWFGILIHATVVEVISYFMPEIDNFWHAQGSVMLVEQRLPLYILATYEVFIYTASVAVSHMNLKWWAEPCAVGLTVVAVDLPYDILAIKLLGWTWHDTDPNIYDRMYWAPWTSYYFHTAFASGFTLAFHGFHRLFGGSKNRFASKGFFKEFINTLLAGCLGFPLGTLQFLPNYHVLHDNYKIHTEVCFLMYAALFVMIIWKGDRIANQERGSMRPNKSGSIEIVLMALVYYIFWMVEVFIEKPENIRAVGLHEPIGPCNETVPMMAASGQILYKKKYLCLENYNEDYFDFHCLKKPPPVGKHWYTICGTPFENHLEYIVVVCFVSLFGLHWILSLVLGSGALPTTRPDKKEKIKQKSS